MSPIESLQETQQELCETHCGEDANRGKHCSFCQSLTYNIDRLRAAGRERGEEGAGPALCPGAFRLDEESGAIICRLCKRPESDHVSASAEPQRAFGPIREAVARQILWCFQDQRTFPDGAWEEYDADTKAGMLQYADRVLALLGEAPPTSGEAEQSLPEYDVNHCTDHSSLVRPDGTIVCVEYGCKRTTPGATVQPQARPMKLRAEISESRGKTWFAVWDERGALVIEDSCSKSDAAELLHRINSFEPPHQGEAT